MIERKSVAQSNLHRLVVVHVIFVIHTIIQITYVIILHIRNVQELLRLENGVSLQWILEILKANWSITYLLEILSNKTQFNFHIFKFSEINPPSRQAFCSISRQLSDQTRVVGDQCLVQIMIRVSNKILYNQSHKCRCGIANFPTPSRIVHYSTRSTIMMKIRLISRIFRK